LEEALATASKPGDKETEVPRRDQGELLEEILELARSIARRQADDTVAEGMTQVTVNAVETQINQIFESFDMRVDHVRREFLIMVDESPTKDQTAGINAIEKAFGVGIRFGFVKPRAQASTAHFTFATGKSLISTRCWWTHQPGSWNHSSNSTIHMTTGPRSMVIAPLLRRTTPCVTD
jgi:hypothetical protein